MEMLGAHEYACILADFKLPSMNGIELLRLVREKQPTLPFVLMTAYGSIEIAVEAMKSGANDFISKPFEPAHLSPMLREVIHHKRIIHRDGTGRGRGGRQILTESPVLQKILSQAKQAA